MAAWARAARALLLDVSGVLYDSGGDGGVPIAGSAEAVRKIKASSLKLRFCTNETQATREKFVKKLQGLGFDISVDEVTAPAPAACRVLKERNLRPHLLVHNDVVPEFAEIDKANPNCVVIGDAADNFSYANLNEAFRILIGLENPVLISLGRGRYYKETDGLKLDVGAYMKALEYACDIQAEVVGKPAKMFFESALAELGVQPQQAIMIGDDIVNDVGGAQQCGMRALQVRTGKYSRCKSEDNLLRSVSLPWCEQDWNPARGMQRRRAAERRPLGAARSLRREKQDALAICASDADGATRLPNGALRSGHGLLDPRQASKGEKLELTAAQSPGRSPPTRAARDVEIVGIARFWGRL